MGANFFIKMVFIYFSPYCLWAGVKDVCVIIPFFWL